MCVEKGHRLPLAGGKAGPRGAAPRGEVLVDALRIDAGGQQGVTLRRQRLRAVGLRDPDIANRSDRGKPKIIPAAELERYCETIAAMKLRTLNGKGRHLSAARAIQILEEHGVDTPQGPVRLPPGLLGKATANRYLK